MPYQCITTTLIIYYGYHNLHHYNTLYSVAVVFSNPVLQLHPNHEYLRLPNQCVGLQQKLQTKDWC